MNNSSLVISGWTHASLEINRRKHVMWANGLKCRPLWESVIIARLTRLRQMNLFFKLYHSQPTVTI